MGRKKGCDFFQRKRQKEIGTKEKFYDNTDKKDHKKW